MLADPFNTQTSFIVDACSGNEGALADLCRFYEPLIIKRLKTSMGLQTADAEDVTQEVLAVLVSRLPTFEYDPTKTFRGFLNRIISNKTFEHWRAAKKAKLSDSVARHILSEKKSIDEIIDVLCINESRLHLEFILKEAKARAAQRGFHETSWQAWKGHYVEEKDYAILVKEMNLSKGALYAAIHRFNKLMHQTAKDLAVDSDVFE